MKTGSLWNQIQDCTLDIKTQTHIMYTWRGQELNLLTNLPDARSSTPLGRALAIALQVVQTTLQISLKISDAASSTRLPGFSTLSRRSHTLSQVQRAAKTFEKAPMVRQRPTNLVCTCCEKTRRDRMLDDDSIHEGKDTVRRISYKFSDA